MFKPLIEGLILQLTKHILHSSTENFLEVSPEVKQALVAECVFTT